MATRKPVRVLPVPVGEATSTSLPRSDVRPRPALGLGRSGGEAPAEPAGHRRMERLEDGVLGHALQVNRRRDLAEAQLERGPCGRDPAGHQGLGGGPVGSG